MAACIDHLMLISNRGWMDWRTDHVVQVMRGQTCGIPKLRPHWRGTNEASSNARTA
jgi:hypothetical protein